jgi:hypothetical protein
MRLNLLNPLGRLLLLAALLPACRSARIAAPAGEAPAPAEAPAFLLARPGGLPSGCQLLACSLSSEIRGGLAFTEIEYTFHNPQREDIEASFTFSIPEGASLAAFALDIGGEMRPAVAVGRTQARQAYEAVARQQIDPALVEAVQGNVFRARIYPIPAGGSRRLRLGLLQALAAEGSGLRWRAPGCFYGDSASFSLRVYPALGGGSGAPLLRWGGDSLRLEAGSGETWAASRRLAAAQAAQASVFLPLPGLGPQVWVGESGPDEAYALLALPAAGPGRPLPPPRRVALFWDASRSALARERSRELDWLAAWARQFPAFEIELTLFREEARPAGRFLIQGGDLSALRGVLEKAAPDGPSCLACLPWQAPGADLILLFSDGLATLGSDSFAAPPVPVLAVHAAEEANLPLLARLGGESGGQHLPLRALSPEEALRRSLRQPLRLLGARLQQGRLEQLCPQPGASFEGWHMLAARLGSDELRGELLYGCGQDTLQRVPLALEKAAARYDGGFEPMAWAFFRLAQLEMRPQAAAAEIRRLAADFSLPSSQTSLLVLERLEDYAAQSIPPPPEMQDEYYGLLRGYRERKRIELLSHLDRVAEQYALLAGWWERDFLPPGPADTLLALDRQGGGAAAGFAAEPASLSDLSKPQEASSGGEAAIKLEAWDPKMPYLDTLRREPPERAYARYLEQALAYERRPSFFLDAGDFFLARGDTALALRVWGNVAELNLGNSELLRLLARKYGMAGRREEALGWLSLCKALRPDEPQPCRDYALLLAEAGRPQEGADSLYRCICTPWPERFPEIGVLMAHELNALAAEHPISTQAYDPRLLRPLPLALRVLLDWDAGDSDLDLWVTDPRGEKCYYAHRQTAIGGWLSRDFTGGYGPEMFFLRRTLPGTYRIEAHYYAASRLRLAGPVSLYARISMPYGSGEDQSRDLFLRLDHEKELVRVAEIEVK